MNAMGIVLIGFAIVLALLNVYASVRLIPCYGFDRLQKCVWLAIVWLVPMLGPILFLSLIRGAAPRPVDPGFTEPADERWIGATGDFTGDVTGAPGPDS